MHQVLYRSFSDSAGRAWRVSELFAMRLAREIAARAEAREVPVPLLFVSGAEQRWVAQAPDCWWDLPGETLERLLAGSRPMTPASSAAVRPRGAPQS